MNLSTIPYDIVDNIIDYLDIDSTINLLMSSKDIYEIYRHNKHFEIVMTNKIRLYFNSLHKLKLDYKTIDINELYTCLNKIYDYFKKHPDTSLSDILIYLCDHKMSEKLIFKYIISHCYFSKNGENVYNAIRADDLLYMLMYSADVHLITTYIFIDGIILLHAIRYKISIKDKKNILSLFNYLLFKHFFRTSEYIEDIITEIVCDVIKIGDVSILDEIYKKQAFYKFKLNYQKIINCCIEQKNIEFLEIVNIKMRQQNQLLKERNQTIRQLMITKESVRSLMKNKGYIMLDKIIELYLKDIININGYFNEIRYNFDYTNKECLKLLYYLNDKNRNIITNKIR